MVTLMISTTERISHGNVISKIKEEADIDKAETEIIAVCQREAKKLDKPKKRYYRKRVDFYLLVNKIKLWPSRKGILHVGQKDNQKGNYAEITTHCGCS